MRKLKLTPEQIEKAKSAEEPKQTSAQHMTGELDDKELENVAGGKSQIITEQIDIN